MDVKPVLQHVFKELNIKTSEAELLEINEMYAGFSSMLAEERFQLGELEPMTVCLMRRGDGE